jgi:Derlin-2/3
LRSRNPQQFDVVSPFSLYYNSSLIYGKWQLWRLLSSFTFFGNLGISFMFNIIFANRYCRGLEENTFRGRPADFLFMLLFGATVFMVKL